MEFLSTDTQECSVDYLLSDTCQDFTDELRLLMEAHDLVRNDVSSVSSQILNTDTGSESGVVSPGSSNHEDDMFHYASKPISTSVRSKQPKASRRLLQSTATDGDLTTITDRNKKNAIAAKLNRQKKKEYVQGLENEVSSLQSENSQLKQWYSKMEESVAMLQAEVEYLKSVLANQSTLSKLLQNIPYVDGVRLSTSFVAEERHKVKGLDGVSPLPASEQVDSDVLGGVCLHVVGNTASLEFCAKCSKRSAERL